MLHRGAAVDQVVHDEEFPGKLRAVDRVGRSEQVEVGGEDRLLDGGQFVHAPRPGGYVRVENLETPYWRERFNGGRRLNPASF